jgi:hypothetical protein
MKSPERRWLLKQPFPLNLTVPGWIPKATFVRLALANVGATGEHTGRLLRELENEGVLEVQYRKGHVTIGISRRR